MISCRKTESDTETIILIKKNGVNHMNYRSNLAYNTQAAVQCQNQGVQQKAAGCQNKSKCDEHC